MSVRITAITLTKRGRYALHAEDGFLFSIDEETMAKWALAKDMELSEEELFLLEQQSDIQRAKESSFRYLAMRAHGEEELYRKLLQRYDEHTAAAAVAAMKENGLLDDEVFAEQKAEEMARRGKSEMEIRLKLSALGINKEIARLAVERLAIDGEAVALSLVQKKYMDRLQRGEVQKVKAALARRGYTHRQIEAAVSAAEQQLNEEDAAYPLEEL